MSNVVVVVIGALLTIILVGYVGLLKWRERMCRKRGHDWEHTYYGMRCRRCDVTLFID